MHTLSKEEKKSLCGCLHGVKVPSGYSSNIKNLVSMEDLKLTGMKSHDCHVLMTQLLHDCLGRPSRSFVFSLTPFVAK